MAKVKSAEKKAAGSFLKKFNDDSENIEGITLASTAPTFWFDTGSYMINHTLSGSYDRGLPQGRLSAFGGPSGAGKTFILGNVVRNVINNKEHEMGVLVLDSENALDNEYLLKIGANIQDNPLYTYRGVTTISQTTNLVSNFTRAYREAEETLPFLIVIDSLDMLQTDSEHEQYLDGEIRGDQGQQAKQLKAMLKRFVNDIKDLNIHITCTKQVYQEQDKIAAYQNPWRFTESLKFAFSQIGMVTRTLIKDDTTKIFEGINLNVRGDKTRFTKPYQKCTIEVPYETGMDRYSGILDAAVAIDIVQKSGKSWYVYNGESFQRGNFHKIQDQVFKELVVRESETIVVDTEDDITDEMLSVNAKDTEVKRKTRGEEPTV